VDRSTCIGANMINRMSKDGSNRISSRYAFLLLKLMGLVVLLTHLCMRLVQMRGVLSACSRAEACGNRHLSAGWVTSTRTEVEGHSMKRGALLSWAWLCLCLPTWACAPPCLSGSLREGEGGAGGIVQSVLLCVCLQCKQRNSGFGVCL
jgi:hypothetical protein